MTSKERDARLARLQKAARAVRPPIGNVFARRLDPVRADTRWSWTLYINYVGYLSPCKTRSYGDAVKALAAGRRAAAKLGVQVRGDHE